MTSGIVFSDVVTRPGYAHVGAWREDYGLISVAYLGTFPKQAAQLGIEIGDVQKSPETVAAALLDELVLKIAAK